MNIDEYLFLKALNCPKYLSLDNSHPELKKTAKGHDNLRDKKKVKELAVKLFPGGVFIDKNLNIEERIRQTKELINAPVIYNAAFSVFDIFFTVDILVNNNGKFEIYKITHSSNPKDNQIKSLSFKYFCLKSLGYNITKALIVQINKNYQATQDKTPDLNNLFIIKDYTKNALSLLNSFNQAVIDFQNNFSYYDAGLDIGEQCFKNDCDFKDYCFKDIPEQSVFNLYKLSINEKLRLYKEKIVGIENIPEELAAKRNIWKVQKENKEFIDKKVIKDFIQSLSYPLSFLDFETFSEAVPSYYKQTPYQNIPFQYSLHILEKNGSLTHKEFLCTENKDPRPGLINSLINDLPSEGKIIAFNDKFEKSVIKELLNFQSDFQPGKSDKFDKLLSLNPRFIDLIIPFKKVGFYLPKMNGSFSLKSVLPAMFPNDLELDYKNMEIHNGLLAMDGYFRIKELRLNNDNLDTSEEIEKIKNNLLKYCKLDTFAMVKILQKLIELYKIGEI